MLGNGERAFIGVAPALNELGLKPRFFHGIGDRLAAAVDDDGAHPDRLHEDDVGKDFAELVIIVHERAAELDDDDLLIEALDVPERFNQRGRFLNNWSFKGHVHSQGYP